MNPLWRIMFVLIYASALSSCGAVESIIVNKCEKGISVVVRGENHKLLDEGRLPSGAVLSLPERPEEVREIIYSTGGDHLCRIAVEKTAFKPIADYGNAPTIYLTGC
jgi:hypothetical protein